MQNIQDHFYVELELRGTDGALLSSNTYMLLIGDQEEASAKMKAMGEELRKLNDTYTYGNYYRFFPDMTREDDRDHQSQVDVPRAQRFEK